MGNKHLISCQKFLRVSLLNCSNNLVYKKLYKWRWNNI